GLANGGFVITWEDENSHTLGDTSVSSIKAQVFDAGGQKLGDEFLVNTRTANWQYEPGIAALPSGEFVVCWVEDNGNPGSDTGSCIKAQVFGATGIKI